MKKMLLSTTLRPIFIFILVLMSLGRSHGQTVRDRWGGTYTMQEIRLPEAGSFRGSGGSCQVGIFNLIFENWGAVGFNDPGSGLQRQAVACQVFSDLSELIMAAPNPYSLPRPAAFVNIRLNQTFVPAPNQVGRGTPFFNFITIPDGDANPYNDFTDPTQREGVLDGEAWRTINGGFDAWYAATQCFPDEGNYGHFHADIQIDFNQFSFHELPTAPPPGMLDLYTVIAHEAMHCLGFLSHTGEVLPGVFGSSWSPNATFFSRYDLSLYPNSLPFITDHFACTGWSSNFSNSADLSDPCNVFFDGPTTSPLEVYAPASFDGSSMEHLDGNCPGAIPYLMHPGNIAGQSRIATQDEANVLCDIDYHVSDHHGDAGSGWVDTYAARTPCGSRLAGVDDIFSDYVTFDPYLYKQGQAGPIIISNFLSNDEDETGVGGIPNDHTCLTVIRGGGAIANESASSFEYTPDPDFAGWAILRYEPLDAGSTRKGNLTYIFIEVWPPDICGVDPCNIVNGGDFELLPWEGQSMTCPPYSNWREGQSNSPDLLGWNGTFWSSQNGSTYWNSCWPGGGNITVPASHNGSPANERYVAMYGGQSGYGREGVQFELCSPLVPGNSYVLDFWAFNGGADCGQSVEFHALPVRACYPWVGPTDLTGGTNNCNGSTYTTQSLITPPTLSQAWQQYLIPFIYSGPANANWLIAVPSFTPPNTGGAAFLDDVKIHPVIDLTSTVTDACTGLSNGSIDLHIEGGVGPFTFNWSNGSTDEDPEWLSAGPYTVTVTDAIGCTGTATFQVNDPSPCDPFTIEKTVSTTFTYSGSQLVYTIVICNNTATAQDVVLTDDGLYNIGTLWSYFNIASVVVNGVDVTIDWSTFPQGSYTVQMMPTGCTTVEITGAFNTAGFYENCATADPADEDPLSDCADIVQVAQNCPLMVSGIGDCEQSGDVNMCMSVHSLISDVLTVDFLWVYPDFMAPPSDFSSATSTIGTIDLLNSTIGVPATYTGIPPEPSYGYEAVAVHLVFTSGVTTGVGHVLCLPFTFDQPIPPGENVFHTRVVGSHGQHATDLYNSLGDEIHATGFYTQAANIILTGCNVAGPSADFTVQVPPCGGAVHVEGLAIPGAIHMWTWGDERTTPLNGAQSYDYNYFAAIAINQIPAYSVPPAAPGTYTITHTVILNGVSSTSQQTITIYECCPAAMVIPDGSFASMLGTVFTGTVDVQGHFTVDDDVLFLNAQVHMEPGAEIQVQGGRILDVENSSFESCQDVMWKSITAESGSTVRIWDSYMDDAESTLSAKDGSTLWIDNTQFHNNRVAIGVPDVGLFYNNVACWVGNSTFYSAGPMAQPYAGQTTAVGDQGFAAVDVSNTSFDLTGGNNIIHSLSNGIVSWQSDVTVSDCRFVNIQPDAAYELIGNGAGINSNGTGNYNYLKQNGYGNTGTPSFEDCRWGVYTTYMNVYSTDNQMLDMGTAYRIERSGYRTVDILNNTVHTLFNGIDLRSNDGADRILVQGNDITFGYDLTPGGRGHYAIYVSEGNLANNSSVIKQNNIHFLPQFNSRYGIALFAADDWLVAENDLGMTDNAFNRTGIWTSGCRRPEVSCNTIASGDNTYPIDGQAAIRNMMGSAPLISCNEMDQTANGILFNGVAYNTDVRGNQFHNHNWPLHLDATAIIDVQTLKGNLWDPGASTPIWGAWYEVSSLQSANSAFEYDPAMIGGGTTVPPSWSPNNWFNTLPGSNYNCSDHHGVHYCSLFGEERCKDCLLELDEKIANEDLENNPYTAESRWMLGGDLYEKLDNAPDLLDLDTDLADFYAELQGSTTAAFKEIEDEQLALYELDNSVTAQLQANRTQIEALMALVKAGMEQLGDETLTPVQRQALLANLNSYRQTINSLTAWNASALQLASSTKVLTAEGVRSNNATITTSELIETNEKTVNEVYLATIGKDVNGFTDAQATELFDIANQCPMVGGNAVFKARSLYWLIDDSYDFDDQLLCLPHGIIVKRMEEQQAGPVSVLPNPASDEAVLVCQLGDGVSGTLLIHDALGKQVARIALLGGNQRHPFSTANLVAGNYHYQVITQAGVLGDGKLTIVR